MHLQWARSLAASFSCGSAPGETTITAEVFPSAAMFKSSPLGLPAVAAILVLVHNRCARRAKRLAAINLLMGCISILHNALLLVSAHQGP